MAKKLKLLFYVFAQEETGLGHWYRSLALAQATQGRGHCVTIASNREPLKRINYIQTHYLEPGDYVQAIQATRPDWLIVDLPHTPPAWIRKMYEGKIVTLNGIGYNQNDGADLRVIQGAISVDLPGEQDKVPTLKGLEYIILRPEIAKHKGIPRGEFSLIWGGGVDSIGLLQSFADWFPEERAFFIVADMTPIPILKSPSHWLLKLNQDSDDLFWWLGRCKKLITAMGMIVPEAAGYLGVPTYVFNASELHLSFAKAMEEAGLIKAWNDVGLPSEEAVRTFIDTPYEINKDKMLDNLGAERVMIAIEERS